jgi:hypothetical protein
VITCGSNVELKYELFANSMRAVQSIVCLENVSELPFYSSWADRKHGYEAITDWERESELAKTLDGVESNVAWGMNHAVADESGPGERKTE